MRDLEKDLASLRLPDERRRPHGPRRRIAALVATVGVAAGAGAWAAWPTAAALVVETGLVMRDASPGDASGSPVLTATGYLVARRQAVISSKIQGRLAEMRVEEGMKVRRNEVLARLEREEYDAQLARADADVRQAEAQVTSSRARVVRAEAELAEVRRQLAINDQLFRRQLIAATQVDADRSQAAVADAALAQAQSDVARDEASVARAAAERRYAAALLESTVIRAPFDGVVMKKMAEVGESVTVTPPGINLSTSSGAIVALADVNALDVELDIAEANIARLTRGQRAAVTVEAVSGQRYTGELRQIVPAADRTKATVLVRLTLLDGDARLRPEMSAQATFQAAEAQPARAGAPVGVTLVPRAAVVARDGGHYVFTATGDVAEMRRVELGDARGDHFVARSGLQGTEVVILNPPPQLSSGMAIRRR